MKIRLQKASIVRDISPILYPDLNFITESSTGKYIHFPGDGYAELTPDITCTADLPTLGFTDPDTNIQYYLKEQEALPEITGVLIFPQDEIDLMLATYRPPTLADIFNSWTRIGNDNGYYPSGTTPVGEANAWQWMGSYARCTVNSAMVTGFISLDTFEQYDSSVIMSSSSADDDYLVFVMAFKREDNLNKLFAVAVDRQPAQHGGDCRVLYVTTNCWSPERVIATHHVIPSVAGWNGAKCQMKVIREGTLFHIYVSPITTGTPILNPTPVTINTKDYPELSWVTGPLPYGYACHSQQYSTFSGLSFKSASNDRETIYNATNGDVWRWSGTTWARELSSQKAWDVLGYPRKVTSVDGRKYQILKSSIVAL